MLIMRRRAPDAPRSFRTPLAWPVGIFGDPRLPLSALQPAAARPSSGSSARTSSGSLIYLALRRPAQRRRRGEGGLTTMLRSFVAFARPALPRRARRSPRPPAAAPALPRSSLQTGEGNIVLELETARAPITSRQFPALCRRAPPRRHRTSTGRCRSAPDAGLIQGGVRDPRRLFPPIAHEPTGADRAQPCRRRALDGRARARHGASATSTIMVGDHHRPRRRPGVGRRRSRLSRCSAGWSRAWTWSAAILAAPTSPTEGDGVDARPDAGAAGPDRHRAAGAG